MPTITPGYYATTCYSTPGTYNGTPPPTGWKCDSATVIAEQFPSDGSAGEDLHNQEPGIYDIDRNVYYCDATCPVISVPVPQTGNSGSAAGQLPTQIRIPALARPSQSNNNDSFLAVEQPDGSIAFMYYYNGTTIQLNPPGGGNWGTAGNTAMNQSYSGGSCASYATGSGDGGINVQGQGVAGQCPNAGAITLNELLAAATNPHAIQHAMYFASQCLVPTAAIGPGGGLNPFNGGGDALCNVDGVGPQVGSRYYYDVPCATTIASPPTGTNAAVDVAILCALHDFGAYTTDSVSGGSIANTGMNLVLESSEPFAAYSSGDLFAALGTNYGWVGNTITGGTAGFKRWTAPDGTANGWKPSNVNFQQHMHILNPCVTQRTC